MEGKFTCTNCTACCRILDRLPFSDKKSSPLYFPYKHKNGVCEKLIGDKCSVYENRPEICDVNRMYKYMDNISYEEYLRLTAKNCNKLIDEFGIPENYKINI